MILCKLLFILSFLITYSVFSNTYSLPKPRCEFITLNHCTNLDYNRTILPNLLNHFQQLDAERDLDQFSMILQTNCSVNLRYFLCFLYVPVCKTENGPLPPCQSLCLTSKEECKSVMQQLNFKWPSHLSCHLFPHPSKHSICATADFIETLFNTNVVPVNKANKTKPSYFHCPTQFQVPKGLYYVFKINGFEKIDCGAPCEGIVFNSSKITRVNKWVALWSIICFCSSVVPVFLYCLSPNRYKYPQKAITFIAFCYVFISSSYLIGYVFGEQIACNEPFSSPDNSNVQMIRTLTQGNHKKSCVFIFMILHFFTLSSYNWWVIMTLTWLLTAGLRWNNKDVDHCSHYFHFLVWAPSLLTVGILVSSGRIEGDVLSGVCQIRIWERDTLALYFAYPLIFCIILNSLLLLIGFLLLSQLTLRFKINSSTAAKHEKSLIKICIFSFIYILPGLILLSCYYYEQNNMDSWLTLWLGDVCKNEEYGVRCPIVSSDIIDNKPKLFIYFVRYFAALIPGIFIGFWLWFDIK